MTEKSYPNILIISNNAISDTDNNGKTLNSIFSEYPGENIRQLYFKSNPPSGKSLNSFFKITDKEMMIKSFKKRPNKTDKHQTVKNTKRKPNTTYSPPKNNISRILRELIWKNGKWKTRELKNWLEEFSPDIVFFMAGDAGFAYDIALTIKSKFDAKLITYITDDYVLPRKTVNILWWFRRNLIFKRMKNAIERSNVLLTISPKMKRTYKQLFHKDSIVISNVHSSLLENKQKSDNKEIIKLIYAGGLHYNRYRVLEQLGKAIIRLNKQSTKMSKEVNLFIYSNSKPTKKILKKINIPGASRYCGSLGQKELAKELNDSDVLVHVESFDKKSIESTRLSLSTKIGEYLSLAKPILAVGPKDIASMEFLNEIAYCINEEKHLDKKIEKLLSDDNLMKELGYEAQRKYRKITSNKNIHLINDLIKYL